MQPKKHKYIEPVIVAVIAITSLLPMIAANAAVPTDEKILAALKTRSPVEKLEYLLELERGTDRDVTILFQTGNAYFALSELDSAVSYYEYTLKIDPQHFKAYVNMGIAYDDQGQGNAARAAYRSALEIQPEDVLAHCHLGHNLVRRGDVDGGVQFYLRALELDPDSPQAHYNLGLAFADLKVFGEAIREWRIVVDIDPGSTLGKTAAENVQLIKSYLAIEP